MSEEAKKRARINRYKKIIMYTFVAICLISIVLWIFICYKMVQIDDRIWRIQHEFF